MSWSPNLDTSLEELDGLSTTFENYAQEDDYGLKTLRPKNVRLQVDEELSDQQTDNSTISVNARAELELDAYRRKLGNPRTKNGTKKWEEQEEDCAGVENEISNMLRQNGLDREPPSNFRPNSKTTSKSAIQIDRIPVPGVNGLYIDQDHFKFRNPFVVSPKPRIPENEVNGITSGESSSSNGNHHYTKTFKEATVGVAGEAYVSPRQLYAMKARRNR